MKKTIVFLLFILASLTSYGQCSDVSMNVSSSDTFYVQLYHPGFFLIPSGFDNICEWEVSTFSGEIIFQDTTSGGANEQGFILFDHSVPITDSMRVSLVITNNMEGITCTISDTLYWEESEVLPGSFIGNWAILNNNSGVQNDIVSSTKENINLQNIEIQPCPVGDYFWINGNSDIYSISVFDLNGKFVERIDNVKAQKRIHISEYSPGMYLLQFQDSYNRNIDVKKLFKI